MVQRKWKLICGASLLACAMLFAFAHLSLAGAQKYRESFETTLYRDGAATTANWDTALGQCILSRGSPTQVGDLSVGSASIQAVIVDGEFAYLAADSDGLRVVDISDPTNPTNAGSFSTSNAMDLAIDGDYLFLADGTNGIRIFNVTNPHFPAQIVIYNAAGWERGVDVDGDVLYVAAYNDGLYTLDISQISSPSFLDRYDTAGQAHAVQVEGDYAYVADGDNGLVIVDVSDPNNLTLAGHYDYGGFIEDVAVVGNVAYLADIMGNLQVLDVSDPTNPRYLRTYAPGAYWGIHELVVQGTYLYAIDDNGGDSGGHLRIFDISEPANPVLVGTRETGYDPLGLAVDGRYAYLGGADGRLRVVAVSRSEGEVNAQSTRQHTLPRVWGSSAACNDVRAVDLSWPYALAANGAGGLCVYDISSPTSPQLQVTLPVTGTLSDVLVRGDIVYAAAMTDGLAVIGIDDPTSPTLITVTASVTGGVAYALAPLGDVLCRADGLAGLSLLDISEPSAPTLLATLPLSGTAYDVVRVGDIAFVAAYTAGLAVVDLSTPSTPTLVTTRTTPGDALGLAVHGNALYVADGTAGLTIFDITNPSAPVFDQNISVGGDRIRQVAVEGDRAYLAAESGGIYVLDISDFPTQVGHLTPTGSVWDLLPAGDEVYLSARDGGLVVVGVAKNYTRYDDWNVAQSLKINTGAGQSTREIATVTLSGQWDLHTFGALGFQVSNNGGTTWETVLPNAPHAFAGFGNADLRWRVFLTTTWPLTTPVLDELVLSYNFFPDRPSNISPTLGETWVLSRPTLIAGPYVDGDGDAHTASQWQVATSSGAAFTSTIVWDSGSTNALTTTVVDAAHGSFIGALVGEDHLAHGTTYYWRVRYRDAGGNWSRFSQETAFTTNYRPATPSAWWPISELITVAHSTLIASDFADPDPSDAHTASQWQVATSPGAAFTSTIVWDSGIVADALTTTVVDTAHGTFTGTLAGESQLAHGVTYYWRVRYHDVRDAWSHFSAPVSFTMDYRPHRPSPITPTGMIGNINPFTVTLVSSAYEDAGSPPEFHAASQWQVATSAGAAFTSTIVWDSGSTATSLTTVKVDASHGTFTGVLAHRSHLDGATTYYWRVRYRDSAGYWSAYSEPAAFVTGPVYECYFPVMMRNAVP